MDSKLEKFVGTKTHLAKLKVIIFKSSEKDCIVLIMIYFTNLMLWKKKKGMKIIAKLRKKYAGFEFIGHYLHRYFLKMYKNYAGFCFT